MFRNLLSSCCYFSQKKRIFVYILVIEILLILITVFEINQKRNILGVKSVHPINKSSIKINPQSQLKYFYEPGPSSIEYIYKGKIENKVYTINSDGLNERFEYSIHKPQDVFRIITLGDSFTFGLYVGTKDNWTEQLEDQLNRNLRCNNYKKFEVINLGMHGYDIQYSVERFKLKGTKYNPDLILWFLKDDDIDQINELMLDRQEYYKKKFEQTGELTKFIESGRPYITWELAVEDINNSVGREKILSLQYSFLDNIREYFHKKLVFSIHKVTREENIKFLISFVEKHPKTYFIDTLRNIYDIKAAYFENDGHPTEKGYAIIAEDLFSHLIKNKIIPCN